MASLYLGKVEELGFVRACARLLQRLASERLSRLVGLSVHEQIASAEGLDQKSAFEFHRCYHSKAGFQQWVAKLAEDRCLQSG
jgi:hypothetical protein